MNPVWTSEELYRPRTPQYEMRFENYSAGRWQQRYEYKSFEPSLVNQEWTWNNPVINVLLEDATRALGELNAFSLIVPDIDVFIEMHVVKEAQTSSKIEGTQTGIGEVLMSESQISSENRDDWREVRNYIEAIHSAVRELEAIPLSNRLLRQAHHTLMQGVRGEQKHPGEFRTSQNWIGGSGLSDAAFVPPHQDSVPALMSDLELFLHNHEVNVPHLIRLAICHYQFETIHPFLDGNGRIGRLMIPLYLVGNGLLAQPSLYISDFFERNRASYYDALMMVRERSDLTHWVRFFLSAVHQTAEKGVGVFQQILKLRNEVESSLATLGRRGHLARRVVNSLYSQPIINADDLSRREQVSSQTANALIKVLVEKNILVQIGGRQRNRLYSFSRYLDLFVP